MKIIKSIIVIPLVVVGIMFLASCGQKANYGQEISNYATTPIGDILKDQGSFEGKIVTIQGVIDTECPTGCWFNLKDDTGLIYVDLGPFGFAIPQIVGRRVTVEGKVKINERTAMLMGRGVELK